MRNAAEEMIMKTTFVTICAAVLVIGLLAQAQPTSSSPDPKAGAETTGTIKEYTPGSILILDTLAPNEPTQFKLSKSVVYADADGKTLEAPGLAKNQKVRVHYMKTSGENVADRVILIKD
jgi:ABC-type transport system substrate-binding protein